MRTLCKSLGLVALALIFVVPFAYAMEQVTHDSLKLVIFVSSLVWFVTAPFWIGNKQPESNES